MPHGIHGATGGRDEGIVLVKTAFELGVRGSYVQEWLLENSETLHVDAATVAQSPGPARGCLRQPQLGRSTMGEVLGHESLLEPEPWACYSSLVLAQLRGFQPGVLVALTTRVTIPNIKRWVRKPTRTGTFHSSGAWPSKRPLQLPSLQSLVPGPLQ